MNKPENFQEIVHRLLEYWMDLGCVIQQPYDVEVGAGTMHPETFFRVLGPDPYKVAYVQPSRRPTDGRYGENPNRVYRHYQLQVILKPAPDDIQDIYLKSLSGLGIPLKKHDLRFEEDNWESPTLGAWGIGWQVLLDGLEITQFTYFQQAGGQDLEPVSAEITYGLERLAMFLGRTRSVYDVEWVAGGPSYGAVRHQDEVEFSKYYFETADVDFLRAQFDGYEAESRRCLEAGLVLPAYECALKCSQLFNVLDARGAISVTDRVAVIKRIRRLAGECAAEYVASRERLGFPLMGSWPEAGDG